MALAGSAATGPPPQARLVHLVVARHGRTAWNAGGRFQGQADPPLDAVGRAQSRRLAADVAPLAPARIASSDLIRARQTAEIVAAACGLEVVTHTGLREVDLGAWEGLDRAQAEQRFPAEYAAWRAGRDLRRGGGETEAEAGWRAAEAVLSLLDPMAPGSTLVVVAHGLVLCRAMGILSAGSMVELDGPPPHLDNGAWRTLEVQTR